MRSMFLRWIEAAAFRLWTLAALGGEYVAQISFRCVHVSRGYSDGRAGGGSYGGFRRCLDLGDGCRDVHRLVVAASDCGRGRVDLYEALQEGREQGNLIQALRRLRSPIVIVAAFLSPVTLAHHDGNLEKLLHYYKVSGGQALNSKTPEQACQDFCPNVVSSCYHSNWYDGATRTWKCQCKAVNCSTPGSIYSFTEANERHCPLAQKFNGGLGGQCGAGGPENCFARAGEYQTFTAVGQPVGFNIEDDGAADGTVWEGLEGCSIRRVSSASNAACWNVTYEVTGSEDVDEDGLPAAPNQGAVWPDGILSKCDPATGQPIPGGGWDGTGGGGGGGTIIPTEETPVLDDPMVEGTADLEQETDSWFDILTEPEEWGEDILQAVNINFDFWNIVGDDCGAQSPLVVELPQVLDGVVAGRQIVITCEQTAQLRHWLGIAVGLAFFWWLLQTALTLPRTGG